MKHLTIIALVLIALTIVAFTALPLTPKEAAQYPQTPNLQTLQNPLDPQDIVAFCDYDTNIKWDSSPVFQYNVNFPSTLISGTNSGAALWNNINGLDFDITLSGQTTTKTFDNFDQTNVIDIVWRADHSIPLGVLARTATWGFITYFEADITFIKEVFNAQDYGQFCETANFHTQSVAVHEFGHAIGLNDYNGKSSVMNTPATNLTCNTTLWAVDHECAYHIYGTVPVSCGDGFCDPDSETESGCPEDCSGGCKRGATGVIAMVPGTVQNDFIRLLRDYSGNRADAYLTHNHLAELDLIINGNKRASKAVNSFIISHLNFLESQVTEAPQKLSLPVVDDLTGMIDVLRRYASKPLKKKLREIQGLFQRSVNLSIREAVDQYLVEVTTVPEHFELVGNYPNPFNPSTVIEYRLAESSQVTVSVYDVMGRLVSTLVNAQQSAGTQRATFEASGLPSGTYLYSVQTAAGVKTGTMQLIK